LVSYGRMRSALRNWDASTARITHEKSGRGIVGPVIFVSEADNLPLWTKRRCIAGRRPEERQLAVKRVVQNKILADPVSRIKESYLVLTKRRFDDGPLCRDKISGSTIYNHSKKV
jgi:hypothetical protein